MEFGFSLAKDVTQENCFIASSSQHVFVFVMLRARMARQSPVGMGLQARPFFRAQLKQRPYSFAPVATPPAATI